MVLSCAKAVAVPRLLCEGAAHISFVIAVFVILSRLRLGPCVSKGGAEANYKSYGCGRGMGGRVLWRSSRVVAGLGVGGGFEITNIRLSPMCISPYLEELRIWCWEREVMMVYLCWDGA